MLLHEGGALVASQVVPRTPRERCGAAFLPRDARGLLLPIDPLKRFAEKCRFDPVTGCVVWEGGTTAGRGNSAVYGSFWYEGRRWFAHRWSGVHIHGLALDGVQAGHCCPHTGGKPNTLCVEHVEAQTQAENLDEMHGRRKVEQSSAERQYWLFVQLGIEREPEAYVPDPEGIPFHEPPEWFRRARPDYVVPPLADCPF